MSNKTQLQTNNTALDGYIARINAAKEVAAGLPEAGGGGSVETCTVTITNDMLSPETPTFYYTDASTLTVKSISTSDGSIAVPKNSIIAISNWSSMCSATGSANQLLYNYAQAAYEITGDCTLIYSM